jgi:hypothetical protein
VELTTADVQVRICSADDRGSYLFRCPTCAMTTVKGAEARTVDLLVASGVRCTVWDLPAELRESRPVGPALTHDDLIDFHEQLADEGWLAATLDTLQRG